MKDYVNMNHRYKKVAKINPATEFLTALAALGGCVVCIAICIALGF